MRVGGSNHDLRARLACRKYSEIESQKLKEHKQSRQKERP